MDRGNAPGSTPPPVIFKDGLGERHLAVNATNEPLEVLALSRELTTVPLFEVALREQVARLSSFHHESHARVRGVLHVGKTTPALAVASDRVVGSRLSDILAVAHEHKLPLDLNAALCLIRQLVSAVARLHEHPTDMWHGAIAPERSVITSEGRLVVVDNGLGTALEHLRFSHERYWKELRIALPQAIGLPRFDHRADVTQVGTVALALILGRPLTDQEYPARIGELADGAIAVSAAGTTDPLPATIRLWLFRALQLDPLRPFASAVEARNELQSILNDSTIQTERAALLSFLVKYDARKAGDAAVKAPAAASAPPAPSHSHHSAAAAPAPAPAQTPKAAEPPPAAGGAAAAKVRPFWTESNRPEAPSKADASKDHMPKRSTGFGRGRLVVAAAVLLAVLSGAWMAARRVFVPSVAAEASGTLVVNTNPEGVAVVIDGQHRGKSPMTLTLSPGEHTLQLVAENGSVRKIPLALAAGAQLSQFIEMPVASPTVGQLQVRTEPSGARVTVDGQLFGNTPVTVENLTPGPHTVVLENDLGSVQESVTIEGGTTASLVVPMRAPKGVPVSGWFAVASPIDVQIFEGQRLLGSSRSDQIMVSAGAHTLEFVNEPLGYRATRAIQVAPGKVSTVRLEMPTGVLSLNALPWAEVWIDGQAAGETPIGGVTLPIGSHTVVFRHPELGEQRATAVVTTKGPTRLSVDLRKK
jgi:hypothetical protein